MLNVSASSSLFCRVPMLMTYKKWVWEKQWQVLFYLHGCLVLFYCALCFLLHRSRCAEEESGKLKKMLGESTAKKSQRHTARLFFTQLSRSVGGLMITYSSVYFCTPTTSSPAGTDVAIYRKVPGSLIQAQWRLVITDSQSNCLLLSLHGHSNSCEGYEIIIIPNLWPIFHVKTPKNK